MMINGTRRAAAVLAAAALVVAACGEAEEPDPGTETDQAAAEESDTDEDMDEEPEPEPEPEPDPEPDPEPEAGSDDLPIGETASLGDFEVTVTEFVADATERVLGDNEFNEPPSKGQYATVTFDATYVGDEEGNPGFDLTAAVVVDGVQHKDFECGATVEGGGMDAPTLEKGGTASGITFCFDYPGLNDGARLFFEELLSFSPERVYWNVS